MTRLRRLGAFCYDFILGDDWTLAVGVGIGIVVTAVLVHAAGLSGWWVMPLTVISTLYVSLRHSSDQDS